MQDYRQYCFIFLIVYCFIAFFDLQAQAIDVPLPPTHLSGCQVANRFASQTDLVNIIKWKAPSDGTPPVAYYIYRDFDLTKLAAIIPADKKLRFKDHNRKKGRVYCYFIVSVDEAGNQSTPALITFKGKKAISSKEPLLESIEIFPLNPQVASGFDLQFRAIGTFSDGTTRLITDEVTWTSSKRRIATISNATGRQGLATGLNPGTTVITASFGCASASVTLTVTSAQLIAIEVAPIDQTIPIGFNERFIAIGLFNDGTTENLTQQVKWTSTNSAVATISNEPGSKGVVTGISSGVTEIEAKIKGIIGSTLLTVTSTQLVSVEVFPISRTIGVGHTQKYIAIGLFSDSTTENLTEQVTWASSNPAVATISNGVLPGLALGISPGTTEISATINGISGSATLKVTPSALVSIIVEPINPSLAAGFTQRFLAIGVFDNGTTSDLTQDVIWRSSNSTVARISNDPDHKGVATGLSPGTTTITAILKGISGSTTLTVTSAVLVALNVTPLDPSIPAGLTQRFTATGVYSDDTTKNLTEQVTWLSSNSTIASISNDPDHKGVARGKLPGSVTITATLNGISGSTTLTVTSALLVSITVDPSTASIPAGFTQRFTATGHFSDGSTKDITEQATWTSSNLTVATVSNVEGNKGVATGKTAGSTTIQASLNGVNGSADLTVTAAILVSITVTPADATVLVTTSTGTLVQYTATGVYSDNTTKDITTDVSWNSSMPVVATISNAPGSKGIATALCSVSVTTISAAIDTLSGFIVGSTSLRISCNPPTILTTDLPSGTEGEPYRYSNGDPVIINVTGGVSPYTFGVINPTHDPLEDLPTGLTLDSTTGVISGTPAAGTGAEIYQPFISVSSACCTSIGERYVLFINPPSP